MAFWLMKTEPSEFSYSDLEREKRAVWDGVTNNTALIHIRAMRKGDRALIYHSGGEKSLVGLADIVSDPYPDPKVGDAKVVVVEIAPAGRLSRPVTLGAVKKEKEFASFELIRISRLSVMPVPPALWKKLLAMAN
jgi:predicted RNA-binding protein with PUA-like domain